MGFVWHLRFMAEIILSEYQKTEDAEKYGGCYQNTGNPIQELEESLEAYDAYCNPHGGYSP